MEKKIAAVGLGDEMLAFSLVGVESYQVAEEEAEELVLRLSGDCAVIFLSEALYRRLEVPVSRFSGEVFPILLPVAGLAGSDGSAAEALKRDAELVGLGGNF